MFEWIKICAVIGGMALFSPTLSSAQDQRPLSQAEQNDWNAIGLVFYGAPLKGAVCTGTLVAADLVLTAAHCVGDGEATAGLTFAAGWRQGQAVASRKARALVRAAKGNHTGRTIANDMALIVLDREISETLVAPLPLLQEDRLAETYSFLGFRRDAPEIITRKDGCALQSVNRGVLQVGCAAVSGNSGAPLLVWLGGKWQVAAVLVSTAANKQPQAFAATPGKDLRTRIAAP